MVTKLWYRVMKSPIGPLSLISSEAGLVRLTFNQDPARADYDFLKKHYREFIIKKTETASHCLDSAISQLEEYFSNHRREFDLEIDLRGTDFQLRVWDNLRKIPYGKTTTYGSIARELGSVARAVGLANGANPVSIIIPCHRVIAVDGTLCGYAGGLENKRFLLDLEGAEYVQPETTLF